MEAFTDAQMWRFTERWGERERERRTDDTQNATQNQRGKKTIFMDLCLTACFILQKPVQQSCCEYQNTDSTVFMLCG